MIPGLRWCLVGWIGLVLLMLGPALFGLLPAMFAGEVVDPSELGFRGDRVAWTTIIWAGGIATISMLIGWGPGRRMARGSSVVLQSACLVPLMLPPALLFDAWWLEVGPDSVLGGAAVRADLVPELRRLILGMGLVCFAWPITTWIIVACGTDASADLIAIDAPPRWRRLRLAVQRDRRPLLLGWLATFGILSTLTVPFDLAQVRTWGFELRTLDAQGASAATVLSAGLPSLLIAMIIGVLAGTLIARGPNHRGRREDRRGGWWTIVVLGALLVLPLGLLAKRAWYADIPAMLQVHGDAILNSGLILLVAAILGGFLAAGLSALIACTRRGRGFGAVILGSFAMTALLPATLVAVGVESVWNHEATSAIYDGPVALLLAVSARVGIAACLIGTLTANAMPRLLSQDQPRRIADAFRAMRPGLLRAFLVGGVASGALAVGEIPVTARIQPPGFPTITSALLNAMHYQYVDSVLPALLGLVLFAAVTGLLVAWSVSGRRVARLGGPVFALLPVLLFGCGDRTDPGETKAVPHSVVFGRPGNIDGRFDYPRAIAMDLERSRIYVVDKTARVQRFGLDGAFETGWTMPRFANGKPTGISIDPEGRVVVADTHEHRIAIFSADGELEESFGGYGEEAGQFVYPTDVAMASDGTWFVSEYGGNDRVQLFDAERRVIGSIGFQGHADVDGRPGFMRPQALAWDDEAQELFIADAVNHRIVVTGRDGLIRRILGGAGPGPGRLAYPYDLALEDGGSILVVEYGNNRVQRLDRQTGGSLGLWGGAGVEPGRLRYPWAIDSAGGVMAVLDTGNNRVQLGDLP